MIASATNETQEIEADAGASESAMPDVRGLTRDEAAQVLADSGFSAAIVSYVDAPSGAPEGVIVSQSPAFGTAAPAEIVLGVAVPATMPELTGMSRDDAVTALSDLGVAATIALQYSPSSDDGSVVSTMPVAGEALGETATISLASEGVGIPLSEVKRLSGSCQDSGEASLGGERFTASVKCGADERPETTVWFLQGATDEFTATIGIDDTAAPGTNASVDVLTDGTPVFTETIAFGKPADLTIPTSGVLQLAIRVSSTPDTTVVLGGATVRGAADAINGIAQ